MDGSERGSVDSHLVHGDGKAQNWSDRGYVVPFTTAGLEDVRVCRTDGRWEFSIPNISGGYGRTITGWSGLCNTFQMSPHDQEFRARIQETVCENPIMLRKVERDVILRGFRGDRAAQSLKNMMKFESNFLTMLKLEFTLRISNLGDLRERVFRCDNAALNEIHSWSRATADRHNSFQPELNKKIDEIVAAIAPIGMCKLDAQAYPGYLRNTANELDALIMVLKNWTATVTNERRGMIKSILREACAAREYARTRIDEMDEKLSIMTATLLYSNLYERYVTAFNNHVVRIAWSVNGWDTILRTFEESDPCSMSAINEYIDRLYRIIPVQPKCAEPKDASRTGAPSSKIVSGRRWVKGGEDWRTCDGPATGRPF